METYTNKHNTIYTIKDLSILDDMKFDIQTKQKRGKAEKRVYYNVACAFDIETSSWYENNEKRACMYIWQFGINGYCFIGRTWKEFKTLYKYLIDNFKEASFICYVHNLSFEYQWMKEHFKWSKVFEVDDRKPVQCITKDGFEFRCSYMLSGKRLEATAEDLFVYKVSKLHTLDYKLIRTSDTILSNDELQYCINDIKVVMSFIQESIERDGGIINIPLTKTGYVRKKCKDACFGKGDDRKKYRNFMKRLTLTEELYDMCRRAFQGGYVHCNLLHSGQIRKRVASFDLTSSYPTVMIAYNLFPMSAPFKVKPKSKDEFMDYIKYYACMFDITFNNIKLKEKQFMPYISLSKCWYIENEKVDNGRILSASKLSTTITEQDWDVISAFYDWDQVSIGEMYVWERGYLPTQLVDTILKLYEDKTQLKGVEGQEVNYYMSKSDLNSTFGMAVMSLEKQASSIEEYNNSYTRFLYYPWGVWITAIARKNLFLGINEMGEDLIYSDTDSLKVMHYQDHMEWIDKYNNWIQNKLKVAMKYHGFNEDRVCPKNKEGKDCPLGVWDFEGISQQFKGLRAKAYLVKKDGKYKLTMSGVNSKAAIDYMLENGNPMDQFKDGLYIPAGRTGKLTHTYIDYEIKGIVEDYQGNKTKYNEKSCVHLDDADFTIDSDAEFKNFIILCQTGLLKKTIEK